VDRRALSASLRGLREDSRLSLEEAAASALDASGAKLSRIETGKQIAGPRDVRDLCRLYGVSEERTAHLVSLATTAREPGWWERYEVNDDDYVGLEAGACQVQQFESLLIPGLLQTRQYASAYLSEVANPGRMKPRTGAQIEQLLAIRETRAELMAPGSAVDLTFVIDEAALRRPLGGSLAMLAQLRRLVELSEHPNVTIRALPFSSGASPGQRGGFTLLTLPDGASDVVYLETAAGFLFLDSPRELAHFRRLFATVEDSCPDERATREILVAMVAELDAG
jgi:transcriptional regulator with XRE-family HTH domain